MVKLFLIGMPGAGKSHWAQILAKKNKTTAYDLDKLIESLEDKTIPELFKEEGEEYFRKTESKVLKWFAEKKHFVLATGGGTPCFLDNIKWMNKNGITIWIDEPVEVLEKRIAESPGSRPLLEGTGTAKKLQDMLENRRSFYAQAQYHLSSPNISEKKFVEILKNHA